ncbi:MAG: tetratricopeptide repeat protein [Calditrichaeota bacterium]|nr:MAG: tetratricopeptide repeat protein [Calditrichota bacterium]MBL1203815.1 tetratricopeptide repeat protein [Calditrichota bacterium]NOG43645.1 tetratricopeptide repeat protein [Calditrichota bacterium]
MYKKLFTLFILISLNLAFANQVQEQFDTANKLYQEKQFEDAIETYEKIILAGFESGDLYFNLGNAYYKTGNIARSRLNYERALLWMEGDDDLAQNLELLKLRLVDQIEPTPKIFISAWWEKLLKLFNMDLLGYFVLGLLWLTLVLASLLLHYRKRGLNRFKTVFVLSLILWILIGTIWISKIYQFETENYGIILKSTVTIHSEPAEDATELFVIHEGTKVQIEGKTDSWFEIRLEDGKTGWLMFDAVEII